jgi:hypothetical protein
VGSCYNANGDHSVECNVLEQDCGGSFYKSGFMSSYSGCCHCYASCDLTAQTGTDCSYYDDCAPTTTITLLAGYTFASDCTQHALIDLDVQDMDQCFDTTYDYACAKTAYTTGGNSVKGTGFRTVQGFSKDLTGEAMYDVYNGYWGSTTYADDQVVAALDGTADATTGADYSNSAVADLARVEIVMKTTQYQNVWMYSIHELESAITKCEAGSTDDDSGAPHAWDEGWAFYAGSLEGTDGSGSGQLVYALADKRCSNFETCGTSGTASSGTAYVNSALLAKYTSGLAQVQTATVDCAGAESTMNDMMELMTIPLVQGTLKYAYYCDPAGGNSGDKACGEYWAFAASILPQIDSCDSDAATLLKTNSIIGSVVPDGYLAVVEAIQGTYDCLGITCAQVGGLAATTGYYAGLSIDDCEASGGGSSPAAAASVSSLLLLAFGAAVAMLA